jgi:hypothetical protein
VQQPQELLDIATWALDEDFPVFPVGSKPKRAVICPSPAPAAFLIAGHRYLFKVSQGWRIQQHWSEVIAFELTLVAGVEAAPCFVALDSNRGEVGVLVEFFYGFPKQIIPPRFLPGADLMRRLVENFDADTDTHHTWLNVLLICRAFRVNERLTWWTKLLAFDALIGNTDRHSENWGLLASKASGRWSFRMAPLFDQGTSLAYQVQDAHVARECTDESIARHIAKGNHHLRWGGIRGHFDVCSRIAAGHPSAIDAMEGVASVGGEEVERIVNQCCGFDLPQGRFLPGRAEYLLKLIKARASALKCAIEA